MYFVVLLPDGMLCRGWRSGCEGFTVWPFPGPLEKLLFLLLSRWKSNSLPVLSTQLFILALWAFLLMIR
jgi:hypothetical protein